MPFQDTVQSRTRTAVTSVEGANFGNALFITANAYFKDRQKPYYSMLEVDSDPAIPTTSSAYRALQHAFAQPSIATPVIIGRRDVDVITYTPEVANSSVYGLTVEVINTTDFSQERIDAVTLTSDVDATAAEISAGLVAAFGGLTTPPEASNYVVVDATGTFTLTPAADRMLVVTEVSRLVDTYTATESAGDCFGEIQNEGQDFYRVTTDSRDNTFVLALAAAVDATESGNYKKQFFYSDNKAASLVTLPDPATDLIGLLNAQEYSRTHTMYHDQSEILYPELALACYIGGFEVGSESSKFQEGMTTPEARHVTTGKRLSPAQVGYLDDRNASVFFKERGVTLYQGGKMASGIFIDIITAKDWIDDTLEVRILNGLINSSNGGNPLTFTQGDKLITEDQGNGVLMEAVDRKILSGFEPMKAPVNVTFEDQAARKLALNTWTGYLAGRQHFVVLNGVLTYTGGTL